MERIDFQRECMLECWYDLLPSLAASHGFIVADSSVFGGSTAAVDVGSPGNGVTSRTADNKAVNVRV